MSSSKAQLLEPALDLAWSLWAELGVSGWQRHHERHAIDPEPLIVFTAALRDADPRLRDESTDWCIKYGRWIAGARLRNIMERESEDVRSAYGEFAATVMAHSPVRWPLATRPRTYVPTKRSRIENFSRASLISLRLRALLGVGARAEIIRIMIAKRGEGLTASELADEIDYTKRNVAEALDGLKMSGILAVEPVRNQLRFRLARHKELLGLIGKRPEVFLSWKSVFAIIRTALELTDRARSLKPNVLEVEAYRAVDLLMPDLQRVGITLGGTDRGEQPIWPEFERIAVALTAHLASGNVDAVRSATIRASGRPG